MVTDALLHLGKITGVHGLGGWLKIYSYTRPADGILDYPRWLLRKPHCEDRLVDIANSRSGGRGIQVSLAGVDSRTEAEQLIGYEVYINREQLPELSDGEYYWVDLIGLSVHNLDGIEFGKISRIMETGANDVLVVQGDRERLIPFVMNQFIKSIDHDAGLMIVDWDKDF